MSEENRASMTAEAVSEQNQIRLDKLNKLIEEGRNPYELVRYDRTHLSGEILAGFEALENQTVSIAGRMMSRRIMGTASFTHVLDRDGLIQVYVRRDDVGEDLYKEFKTWDIGDMVGVKGT
ncbi:MAG: lysine--tRNA ligase, partial [Clostridia bacterium]|nr:lysine--tRNA ligase [Clostridia bacterium]